MQLIFQKVELDDCLTALICGAGLVDTVEVVAEQTRAVDLEDPLVLCIEAGGIGQIQSTISQFRSSRPTVLLSAACRQAAGHQWRN
jgi:hypothetical protein